MTMVPRILIGLLAALFLFMGLQFWFAQDQATQGFNLVTQDLLARASIRADFGVTFLGIGIMSAMAAWRKSAAYAWGAMLLMAIAFCGRLVSILLEGPAPGGTQPMVVEALGVAILFWGYRSWKTS
jgi:Domain of unknown function (DUF4345)